MSRLMPEGAGFISDCCQRCWSDANEPPDIHHWVPMRMIVCPDCGNKRCPKATNHLMACTGSNEPGQPGSLHR